MSNNSQEFENFNRTMRELIKVPHNKIKTKTGRGEGSKKAEA
jgi:hypothetical protein